MPLRRSLLPLTSVARFRSTALGAPACIEPRNHLTRRRDAGAPGGAKFLEGGIRVTWESRPQCRSLSADQKEESDLNQPEQKAVDDKTHHERIGAAVRLGFFHLGVYGRTFNNPLNARSA